MDGRNKSRSTYVGEIYERGDWLGKAVFELDTKDGLVISFIRYSSHHNKWSLEYISEQTFKDWNYPEVDWFPEEKPEDICFCDWIQ